MRQPTSSLLFLAMLAFMSCGGDEVVGPRPPVNIPFVTILEGGYWGCAECDSSVAAVFLIENRESWRVFWESASRDIAASAPPPAVDFENWVVLALLDEAEPRASWILIDSVRREQDRIVVRATRRMGCFDAFLPTPPFRAFHIVRIHRRVAPVDLHLEYEDCPLPDQRLQRTGAGDHDRG